MTKPTNNTLYTRIKANICTTMDGLNAQKNRFVETKT
jgi:hypothetical protein